MLTGDNGVLCTTCVLGYYACICSDVISLAGVECILIVPSFSQVQIRPPFTNVLSSYHFRKSINYRVPLNVDVEDPEEWQKTEQEKIDTAEPLSEDQLAEKEKLLQSGFSDWSRRDFNQFVRAVGEYGRDSVEKVATEVEGKEPKEVTALCLTTA